MENMIGIFQSDTPFLVSIFILFVMSCLSIVFSLSFRLKSRAIERIPNDLSFSVFDKTFNVFNPYSDRRKIIHSFIILLPVFAVVAGIIFPLFTMKIIEMKLALGLSIFIICFGLMMIEEAYEVYKNANIFLKAVKNSVNLGKGDLTVLFLVKETLPKLTVYYLLLGIMFFASSMALPYIVPATLLTFAQLVRVTSPVSMSFAPLAPYLVALLLAIFLVTVQLAAKKVKSKVFSFPPSEKITSLINVGIEAPLDI
jgi:hypothetical protein